MSLDFRLQIGDRHSAGDSFKRFLWCTDELSGDVLSDNVLIGVVLFGVVLSIEPGWFTDSFRSQVAFKSDDEETDTATDTAEPEKINK